MRRFEGSKILLRRWGRRRKLNRRRDGELSLRRGKRREGFIGRGWRGHDLWSRKRRARGRARRLIRRGTSGDDSGEGDLEEARLRATHPSRAGRVRIGSEVRVSLGVPIALEGRAAPSSHGMKLKAWKRILIALEP